MSRGHHNLLLEGRNILYEYECPSCSKKGRNCRFDISKPLKDASKPEYCGFCDGVLRRVFTVPNTPASFTPYHHKRWGVTVSSESQYQRELKKHREVEGHDIIQTHYKDAVKHARWKQKRGLTGKSAGELQRTGVL